MKPFESMLGKDGSDVRCTPFIHWFAIDSKVRDKCVCGQTTKQGKKRKHNMKNNQ